ncbi:MAG: PQQ-dependent sugar dehydrogenase [Verrucomicrobiae bacterium]|nr:PQQ-dependent sugar dehydrogenase [Verrucomicrobiae bacterium]
MALLGFASLGVVEAQYLVSSPPRLPYTASSAGYQLVNAMPNLNFPMIICLAVPPGRTNELFVVERAGRIFAITNLASPTLTVFLDLRSRTFTAGECGMTGLAFHPNYAANRTFFVFYTPTNQARGRMENTVVRFQTDPTNPWRALPASEQELFAQHDTNDVHQAGDLHFGPDGYLYVALGDGGWSTGWSNVQRIDRDFFSGILRLDVDQRPGSLAPNPHPAVVGGYRIPPDNPFIGTTSFAGSAVNPAAVRTEFWAVGMRNPFRFSFDSATGHLYATDIGNVTREEINRVVRGGNYGSDRYEGSVQLKTPTPGVTYRPPLYEYGRSGGDPNFQGICVIGGVVYRGTRHPELIGRYVFGDYGTRHIWALDPGQPSGPGVTRLLTASGAPISFFVHPGTGDLLVVERNGSTGRISRLQRTEGGGGPALPQTLSATGVFADLRSLEAREGMLPYEVNLPFWSDHAVKYRWFFLQDPSAVITRDATDRWSFPAGTVWVKHFELDLVRGNPATRRRLETRFLVKTAGGAYGITYRWRPDGTDADLVPEGGSDETILIQDGGVFRGQHWRYPGRAECMVCHNGTAGEVLGFSTRQLNRSVLVGGTPINQLTALGNLGVLQPPHSHPETLTRLAPPGDLTSSLEHRFRSYLDVNCAYCHLPGGVGRGLWDGRLETAFHEAGIVNGAVLEDLGINGARVIAPNQLTQSMIWHRISQMGDRHMPPLATSELNAEGMELVREFVGESPALRTTWMVGTRQGPTAPGYPGSAFAEFSVQNQKADPGPGAVTRLPGDPQFSASDNPGADDNFYFAGTYPAGFNGLTAPLNVPNDEPPVAWERAHSGADRTNRVLFVLSGAHVVSGARLRLQFEICSGAASTPGSPVTFGEHHVLVRYINPTGQVTPILSRTLTAPGPVEVVFPASEVSAAAGPNAIEVIRTGPSAAGVSYWLIYDYLRVDSDVAGGFPLP